MIRIAVIIPAFNEEESIGQVIAAIPSFVNEVIVVDNNSTDCTSERAIESGATVLKETKQGYGSACLKGIRYLCQSSEKPDIVVFLDADFSDYPEEMSFLIEAVSSGQDLVIGSRASGKRERGAMLPQQIFGNWLATTLLAMMYGVKYTDLGPFRAIRFDKLMELQMIDADFGWTVEMQLKAAKMGFKIAEVPVSYRKRQGISKISGTVKGTVLAGYKILYTIFKYY